MVKSRRKQQYYSNFTHIGCEPGPVVTPDGMLAIPWPKQTDGNDLKLDLLLATANYPFPAGARDPGVFPTADAIAKAWLAHATFINYFYANRIKGIYTAQDPAINRILSKKANL